MASSAANPPAGGCVQLTVVGRTLRFFGEGGADRLLLVNLGRDLLLCPVPEPLLAPPEGRDWEALWSSESPRYGGCGMPAVKGETGWRLHGESAVVVAGGAA